MAPFRVKTSFEPSGDELGEVSMFPPVTVVSPLPAAVIVWTSLAGVTYASLAPSGDHDGSTALAWMTAPVLAR